MRSVLFRFGKLLTYTILTLLSAVFLIPVILTVTNSLISSFEITSRYTSTITASNGFDVSGVLHYVQISLIPDFVTMKQYGKLFLGSPLYLGLFWNSVKITLPAVAGQLIISVPAAYAFEMSKLKYKEIVFFIYIVVMLMPLQVVLVPNFMMADLLHINGTALAIILPGIFNPFGVFLIRQSLKGLPQEYVEAAQVDGANHLQIIISIIRPMIMSAISALVILTFIEYWNVVDQAVVFIKDGNAEPLSVYLSRLGTDKFDMIFAASCFYMVPPLIIFLFGHDNMIEGIQLSGIK